MSAIRDDDEYWMERALAQAAEAGRAGEVPVGAVVVMGDALIAEAHNQPIGSHDPSAHAEMLALRAACRSAENYRLPGATLYVTLEPCVMCAGAIIHARVTRVVYGTADPKTGAAGSVFDTLLSDRHNHRVVVEGGVLADRSARLLTEFFAHRRARQAQA